MVKKVFGACAGLPSKIWGKFIFSSKSIDSINDLRQNILIKFKFQAPGNLAGPELSFDVHCTSWQDKVTNVKLKRQINKES